MDGGGQCRPLLLSAGALLGCSLVPMVADSIGRPRGGHLSACLHQRVSPSPAFRRRRKTILLISTVYLLGSALEAASGVVPRPASPLERSSIGLCLLLAGRAVCGVASGSSTVVVPMYLGEHAGDHPITSLETTRDHSRSLEITRDHPTSPDITRDHPRSLPLTRRDLAAALARRAGHMLPAHLLHRHLRCADRRLACPRSPEITRDHPRLGILLAQIVGLPALLGRSGLWPVYLSLGALPAASLLALLPLLCSRGRAVNGVSSRAQP